MKRTRGNSAGGRKCWKSKASSTSQSDYECWEPYNYQKSWFDYESWDDQDINKQQNNTSPANDTPDTGGASSHACNYAHWENVRTTFHSILTSRSAELRVCRNRDKTGMVNQFDAQLLIKAVVSETKSLLGTKCPQIGIVLNEICHFPDDRMIPCFPEIELHKLFNCSITELDNLAYPRLKDPFDINKPLIGTLVDYLPWIKPGWSTPYGIYHIEYVDEISKKCTTYKYKVWDELKLQFRFDTLLPVKFLLQREGSEWVSSFWENKKSKSKNAD